MWRVIKVCPNCLSGEFEKTEGGYFKCIKSGEENDKYDLDEIDIEE